MDGGLEQLRAHERRVYSQGGEDGVIAQLFSCIGATNRYFVEFGAWDGRHLSNTANLRLHGGWTGLLLDGDASRCVGTPVKSGMVTPDNVNALFAEHGVPESFDLLSLDIDGHEYWVWRALTSCRPRVVVVEYNIFFGLDVACTIPYRRDYVWDKTAYHGASLAALRKLGREKGYSLVHTDSYAPNAFFVADDELPRERIDPPIERVAAWHYDGVPPELAGRDWVAV